MTAPGDPPPPARRGPLRWVFEDRDTGRITIAQWPNVAMWIVIAVALVRALVRPKGRLDLAAKLVIALALTWWAADEVIRGSNPWRRLLGVAVLAGEAWYFWPR